MASLFISYSRKDINAARKITEAFKGQELDFWIDWEGIPPTVDWWKEIQKGIEEADIFLFLLGPDSAASRICNQELEHAIKNGKRLIPVVVRDIKADESPPVLRPLNWIFLREKDDFERAFGQLMGAIKTDYDWVQWHRQLQVKALEWERGNRENSLLLRGKELQDAEFQLATNTSKEPFPTDLQREYVLTSRQASDRQRRITTGIAIAAGIALASLALFGWVQAGRATTNAQIAQTQEAFAQAQSTQAIINAVTAQSASTLAFHNAETAQSNAEEAQREARLARAREISTWAQTVAQPYSVDQPLLALTALQLLQPGDPSVPAAERILREVTGLHHPPPLGHAEEVATQLTYETDISSDGHWLATAYSDGVIDIWHLGASVGYLPTTGPYPPTELSVQDSGLQGIDLTPLESFDPTIDGPVLSNHGKWLVVAYNHVSILLWNLQTPDEGQYLLESEPVIDFVDTMVFSPDENWLAIADRTFGRIFLFDLRKPKLMGVELGRACTEVPCADPLRLYFVGNGNKLLVIGDTGEAYLIDLADSQAGFQVFAQDKVTEACSSDQRCLLLIHGHEVIQSSEEVTDILAISPDNRWLVGRSNLRRFGLWDTQRPNSEPIILPNIVAAAFNADGSWLVLAGPDRFLDLWYVEEKKLMQVACQIAGRNFTDEEWVSYFGNEPYQANCPDFPNAPPQPTPTGGFPFDFLPTLPLTPSLTP